MSLSSRIRRRFWLLLAAVVGFGVCAVEAQDNTSKVNSGIVSRREKAIRKELKSPHLDEWSGRYYYGDGLGTNVVLLYARESGFVFTLHGCLGLYDQNYGDVTLESGRLQLAPKLPNDPSKGFSVDFYRVRWGARHYLISSDEIVQFANSVNAGFEPRKYPHGRFLLKDGDEKKRVSGPPPIPVEYTDYILRTPLDAHIVSVGKSRSNDPFVVHTVVLNIGSVEGVRKGMEFFVIGGSYGDATVLKVDDHSSEAELSIFHSDERPSPGQKLSTRLRDESGS